MSDPIQLPRDRAGNVPDVGRVALSGKSDTLDVPRDLGESALFVVKAVKTADGHKLEGAEDQLVYLETWKATEVLALPGSSAVLDLYQQARDRWSSCEERRSSDRSLGEGALPLGGEVDEHQADDDDVRILVVFSEPLGPEAETLEGSRSAVFPDDFAGDVLLSEPGAAMAGPFGDPGPHVVEEWRDPETGEVLRDVDGEEVTITGAGDVTEEPEPPALAGFLGDVDRVAADLDRGGSEADGIRNGILNRAVGPIRDYLGEVDDRARVLALYVLESEGKARKGVLEALEKRAGELFAAEALTSPGPALPDEELDVPEDEDEDAEDFGPGEGV